MPYADLNNLIADYIPEVKNAKETAALGRILDNVSAFVDSYCKRSTPLQPTGYFSPATEDSISEKRLRGEGQNFLRLPIHVFGSIESVTLNGTVIDSNSYYESDKSGWLYFEDEAFGIEDGFDDCNRIWHENRIYKVRAKWGYAATPLPIVEAVRLIVLRIWSTQRGVIGQVTPEGFVQERLIPAAAKELLQPFIKREFEI